MLKAYVWATVMCSSKQIITIYLPINLVLSQSLVTQVCVEDFKCMYSIYLPSAGIFLILLKQKHSKNRLDCFANVSGETRGQKSLANIFALVLFHILYTHVCVHVFLSL